ncbi:MAG: flavohemoglobin expression-modulating QEGLA motif protein [Legionellaceae bacterium]|nr:flavohemoglobin expression-modulating QEGLA motif protein [Legionellaceae bacterium]
MADISKEQEITQSLSLRIVEAQKHIRILDAVKWDESIKADFFAHGCQKQPAVNKSYYQKYPLPFKSSEKKEEFRAILRDARNQLGQYSSVTRLLRRRCEEYITAVNMLNARGTVLFSDLAQELYGSPDDVFYVGGPKLSEMGAQLFGVLDALDMHLQTQADDKTYTPEQAQLQLQERLARFFIHHPGRVTVSVSDDMVADAAAGADKIKLSQRAMFSERDLAYLEVHEGWVHVGTTLNGMMQPYCAFLSKGSPSCSVLQEGLAVITEVFTFSSNPARLRKITNRVIALDMVENGASFVDVYRYFGECGLNAEDSYNHAVRIFRGSTPTGGAFTKDLSYAKGFVQIYNFILFAIAQNRIDMLPLLFSGKIVLDDLPLLAELKKNGLLRDPAYIPTPFRDFSALSAWLSMSLFLNKFDMELVQNNFQFLLAGSSVK